MSTQYGFSFDKDRCVQCYGCEVACKSWREWRSGCQMEEGLEHLVWSLPTGEKRLGVRILHALR